MVIILAVVIIIILKAAGVGALRNVPLPLPSFHVGALSCHCLSLLHMPVDPFSTAPLPQNHVSMAFHVKHEFSDCTAPWGLLLRVKLCLRAQASPSRPAKMAAVSG